MYPKLKRLSEVPIFDEKCYSLYPDQHPWASESKIAMNTLKGQEMLMLDDGHCLRNQALDYCFTAGAKEDSHFQATSLETLRNMVAS